MQMCCFDHFPKTRHQATIFLVVYFTITKGDKKFVGEGDYCLVSCAFQQIFQAVDLYFLEQMSLNQLLARLEGKCLHWFTFTA